PDANLSTALGAGVVKALAKDKALLQSVVKKENASALEGFYELTVKVDNVIEKFAKKWGNSGDIITLGWSKNGGQGCYCTENNALNAIIRSIPKNQYDFILIDGEAGLEHLSRGLTAKADLLIVVLQSGQRSVQTAQDAHKLALDIGIKKINLVLNGYVNEDEINYIKEQSQLPISYAFSFNNDIRICDLNAQKIALNEEYKNQIKEFIEPILDDFKEGLRC
ncbi:MAG: hypothetical protein WC149_12535, partial [Arcobacteraceae bacterium]